MNSAFCFFDRVTIRETKVFLHCDESVSVPKATTEGDSGVIFNYVC